MGNLADFQEKTGFFLNPQTFVETGSGAGASIAWALSRGVQKIISIEIVPETVEKMRKKFPLPNVEIIEGSSRDKLEGTIENAGPQCLIFLDAHCPGQFNYDLNMKEIQGRYSPEDRNPLHEEIEICMKFCHTVLIDDAATLINWGMLTRQLPERWEMRYFKVSQGYVLLTPPE